jgi:hypothetical protein
MSFNIMQLSIMQNKAIIAYPSHLRMDELDWDAAKIYNTQFPGHLEKEIECDPKLWQLLPRLYSTGYIYKAPVSYLVRIVE